MKRELHDLLHNLVDDAERPPEPEVNVSEASRQKVNEIVDEMNRGQQTETLPKPVYDKPPSRKRPPVVTPDPVSHFSETPSQNPAVRMHDRLLEDALPKPDAERKPVRKTEHKSSKKKHKKTKSAPEASKPKKEFHIEIKEELPPDIPRDTSVADRLKQEKLEAVLAATPPKTPEQIRREKIRKRAAEIKQQMELQAKQKQELPPEQPEPEEIIPAWEDELSEFSEKSETQNSEQLKFLQESETSGVPELSELPEIPQTSGDDTGLMQISEELGAELPAAPKKKKKKKKKKKSAKSEIQPEIPDTVPEEPQKKSFAEKISAFWEKVFTRDTAELKEDVPDTEEETSAPEPRVYQPPEKITEVLLEEEQPQEAQPNLDFVPTAALEAVPHQETPKTRKKVSVSRRKKKSS